MQIIQQKTLARMDHAGSPGSKAREIFENYDFGSLEVLDFDGAESTLMPSSGTAESLIRFYVAPEDGSSPSTPMLFRVAFGKGSTLVTVYG